MLVGSEHILTLLVADRGVLLEHPCTVGSPESVENAVVLVLQSTELSGSKRSTKIWSAVQMSQSCAHMVYSVHTPSVMLALQEEEAGRRIGTPACEVSS